MHVKCALGFCIKYFTISDLSEEEYILGRKETCQIPINGRNLAPNMLGFISKEHFRISRDSSYVPYIKDLSRNGTFLNGGMIGKGNVSTLCTGDIIAIGNPKLEGLLYIVFSVIS